MANVTMKMVANAVLASLDNKDASEVVANDITVEDVRNYFNKELDKAERRNSKAAERNKAKKAEADRPLMEAITSVLKDAENPMSGAEIRDALATNGVEVTSHKVAALVKKMDEVKAEKVKGKNAYSL